MAGVVALICLKVRARDDAAIENAISSVRVVAAEASGGTKRGASATPTEYVIELKRALASCNFDYVITYFI